MAGRSCAAQHHFSEWPWMDTAMCSLAAALVFSEAPELGADTLSSQIAAPNQNCRSLSHSHSYCLIPAAQWGSHSIQGCFGLSSKNPLSRVTTVFTLLLLCAVCLPIYRHCSESQASSCPLLGKGKEVVCHTVQVS